MRTWYLILCCVTLSCSGVRGSLRNSRQADLRQRAAFDLKCSEQLEIVPLDDDAREHGGGTTGVRGCGRQATYIWNAHGTGWVLNANEPDSPSQ